MPAFAFRRWGWSRSQAFIPVRGGFLWSGGELSLPLDLCSCLMAGFDLWQVHPLTFGGAGRQCCLLVFAARPILACSVALHFSPPSPHIHVGLIFFPTP